MAAKKHRKSPSLHMEVDGDTLKAALPEILNEDSLAPLGHKLVLEKDREQTAWKVLGLDAAGVRTVEPSALLWFDALRRALAQDGRALKIEHGDAAMVRLLVFFGLADCIDGS